MPVVSEVRHPQSLDFANERKALLLRDVHGLTWAEIQRRVVNLRGKAPSVRLLQRAHSDVNRTLGQRQYKYSNCGRKAVKSTPKVQKYLVQRLLYLRTRSTCTSSTLRRAKLRQKLCLAMDGVVLSLPPRDATDRANYCAHGDTHMWRLPSEAACVDLAGHDPYPFQIPADRIVPLWGGLSEGGFAIVTFHQKRKLTTEEWCRTVRIWRMPASSPDLNPVEKMWAWLRRKIRALDCEDLRKKRPPIGKTAFKARVRNILASKTAQTVAARIAVGFRKTCKE
ncbi:unnamed protein product, partial [Symbiodinium sp. CCMP2456]